MRRVFLAIFLVLVVVASKAQLRMPKYFSDHAVLQREQPVPLWGWASPGSQVSVAMFGKVYEAKTGADSIWRVSLPSQLAGGPHTIKISGDKKQISIKDIYFGDVFFCSGQSNMVFLMKNEVNRREEDRDFPLVRQFQVYRNTDITPQLDVPRAEWMIAEQNKFDNFSAVAYYFAKEIHKEKKIPVGILLSAYGGSPIEAFMSPASLRDFPVAKKKVDQISPEFMLRVKLTNDSLKAKYPKMKEPKGFVNIANRYPTMIYHGMITPFFTYPVKGVLWYQGEANTIFPVCYQYKEMLANLVQSWRKSWNNNKLPFFISQLPNYGDVIAKPESSAWAIVQEAQYNVSKDIENVYTSVANDVGNPTNLHPTNKKEIGKRLSALVSKYVYGDNIVAQGPTLREAVIKDNTIEVSFDNVGGGLVAKDGGKELLSFALAGSDNKFYRAIAEIKGGKVLVSSPDVPKPIYVRYAFESSPEKINFYNREGFPAAPFRTDKLKDAIKRK